MGRLKRIVFIIAALTATNEEFSAKISGASVYICEGAGQQAGLSKGRGYSHANLRNCRAYRDCTRSDGVCLAGDGAKRYLPKLLADSEKKPDELCHDWRSA